MCQNENMSLLVQRLAHKSNKKMTPQVFRAIYKEWKSKRRKLTMEQVCENHGTTRANFYFHHKRAVKEGSLNELLKIKGTSKPEISDAPNSSPGQMNTSGSLYPAREGEVPKKANQDKKEHGITIR
jgi:hypothetical protein